MLRLSVEQVKAIHTCTIYQKAARLGFGLAQNHAFIDGNKRIAALVVLSFLSLNGIEIDCTEFELFSLFMRLADGALSFDELTEWIINHEHRAS